MPADVKPAIINATRPRFADVEISRLGVDPRYQRDLSDRSVRLIRRMVEGWDWAKFKPPVIAAHGDCFLVIDGQHTCIAAATHGGFPTLPAMIVPAEEQAEQARAFLGHNRDRVNITNTQMYFAALAAGDELALTVQQVCDRAGATMLRHASPGRPYRPGEIVAVQTLVAIVRQRTAQTARRALEICVKARMAPIPMHILRAVDELINGASYAGEIDDDAIVNTLLRMGPDATRKAEELALAKRLPLWKATTIILFQNTRKRRGQG
jgi:hypothetical protein